MSQELSYQRHSSLEADQANASRMPACFTAPDTVDAWRHRRMHEMLLPLIEADPQAMWMTVGDGSFGSDAYFLQQQGADVLATSLTDASLRIAHEKGFLNKFAAVNAEEIPFADDSFDYVLCKEAYHHFPRPAIAFYEMLRVAKEAVVLIEPYDGPKRLMELVKEPMKKLLWGKTQTIHFEPSGNYIYRVNPKEMGKKLAALGYAAVAYKTFNDIYLPQFGKSKSGGTAGHLMTRLAIFLQDILCAFRLLNPGLVTLVCFKHMPSEPLLREMKQSGFSVEKLPENPYK
ncbi:MAG: methyltransferase domain-containing protein [Lentisphaerae bacterium]|jgi:ubiquinone/menaquinone biosynthesis C-methylase UbiE|nr:methyltransferase domain-containing protein [Lentisphaerota bacterium]